MEDVIAFMEDTTPHTEDVKDLIDDATAHIAPVQNVQMLQQPTKRMQ